MSEEQQEAPEPDGLKDLIWLYPQHCEEEYVALREELARGKDAFKLNDPDQGG